MRCLVTVLALLALPGLAAAQASGSLRAQARVVEALPSPLTLAAVGASPRVVSARGVMAVGLAMVAERPAAARPGDRSPAQRVVEVSFLRN